jgi:hypothetical protein
MRKAAIIPSANVVRAPDRTNLWWRICKTRSHVSPTCFQRRPHGGDLVGLGDDVTQQALCTRHRETF